MRLMLMSTDENSFSVLVPIIKRKIRLVLPDEQFIKFCFSECIGHEKDVSCLG